MSHYKRIKRDLVHKGSIIDFYHDTIEINGIKGNYL